MDEHTATVPGDIECPSCGGRWFVGVHHTKSTFESHPLSEKRHSRRTEYESNFHWLRCEDCTKSLVVDGEWVVDLETGETRTTDSEDHRTLDSFEQTSAD